FRFRGGAGFEIEFPLTLSIGGIIELQSIYIRLAADPTAVKLVLAATAGLKIGPLAATVDRIGLQGTFKPTSGGDGSYGVVHLEQAFKPPSGAGMSIKAGPVTGGGYIF